MQYKYIKDLTSDVMFEAYGKDLKEVFENAALAMFETICHNVEPKDKREVTIKADSIEDLMFAWLQELIAMVDIEEMFFSKFEILSIENNALKANVYGEPLSPGKGETVVKAVTNYGYKFEKTNGGYKVTVSLDI